jgi:hypothetical protein
MIKKLIPILLVILLALWVARPLITPGFIPTHDGEYHLIRFFEFDKNIRAGNLIPRWAPGLNSGYGVPLFSFFYPLPNYLAEFFHLLGLGFINSFKMTLAMSILAAGFFYYLWAKKLWGEKAGIVGAAFYIFAPYFLLDVYVRGSIGEVLALALYPAILWTVEKKSVLAPIFLALLILSHNILAFIFIPFLISYLIFRKLSINYLIFIVCTSFGLSCFFWLPALMEAKFVTGLKIVNFTDHFPTLFQLILPSWGTGYSVIGINDGMSFQVGIPHLLAVAMAVILMWTKKVKKQRSNLLFFLGWFLIVFLLLQEFSLPLWRIIPFMSYFQYPWRLLSLIILVASAMAGIAGSSKINKYRSIMLVFLVLFFYSKYCRPVVYQPRDDNYYLSNTEWSKGTATLANSFNTKWFSVKSAQEISDKLKILTGKAKIKEISTNPTSQVFQIETETVTDFKTHIAYFPGWKIMANNKEKLLSFDEGVIGFQLDKGNYEVKIIFTDTPIRALAYKISFLSLLLLTLAVIFKKRYENCY